MKKTPSKGTSMIREEQLNRETKTWLKNLQLSCTAIRIRIRLSPRLHHCVPCLFSSLQIISAESKKRSFYRTQLILVINESPDIPLDNFRSTIPWIYKLRQWNKPLPLVENQHQWNVSAGDYLICIAVGKTIYWTDSGRV